MTLKERMRGYQAEWGEGLLIVFAIILAVLTAGIPSAIVSFALAYLIGILHPAWDKTHLQTEVFGFAMVAYMPVLLARFVKMAVEAITRVIVRP